MGWIFKFVQWQEIIAITIQGRERIFFLLDTSSIYFLFFNLPLLLLSIQMSPFSSICPLYSTPAPRKNFLKTDTFKSESKLSSKARWPRCGSDGQGRVLVLGCGCISGMLMPLALKSSVKASPLATGRA